MSGFRRLRWVLLPSVVMLSLAACTENAGLFSSLDEEQLPVLETVEDGSVMAQDDTLEIQIAYPNDESARATRLEAQLLSIDGDVVGGVLLDQDVLAEPQLPPIRLPEPSPGVYTFLVTAWSGETELFSEQRRIFVLDQAPELSELTIQPTSIDEDMQALAVAEVDASPGTRPFLRWLFDGEEVARGYLENGGDRAVLDGASRHVGAYGVTLEIYPWGPEEGVEVNGATTLVFSSDVYIREAVAVPDPGGVVEVPEHVLLFHSFDGTVVAWTPIGRDDGEPPRAHLTGTASLDVEGGALGFRMGGDAALSVVIPVPADRRNRFRVAVRVLERSVGEYPDNDEQSEESLDGDGEYTPGAGEWGRPLLAGFAVDGEIPLFVVVERDGVLWLNDPVSGRALAYPASEGEPYVLTLRLIGDDDGVVVTPDGADLSNGVKVSRASLEPQTADAGRSFDRMHERFAVAEGSVVPIRIVTYGAPTRSVFVDRVLVNGTDASSRVEMFMDDVVAASYDGETERFVYAAAFSADATVDRTARADVLDGYVGPKGRSVPTTIQDEVGMEVDEDQAPLFFTLLPDGGGVVLQGRDVSAAADAPAFRFVVVRRGGELFLTDDDGAVRASVALPEPDALAPTRPLAMTVAVGDGEPSITAHETLSTTEVVIGIPPFLSEPDAPWVYTADPWNDEVREPVVVGRLSSDVP